MEKIYTKSLHILITPEQQKTLKQIAKRRKVSIGQIIRELIESL